MMNSLMFVASSLVKILWCRPSTEYFHGRQLWLASQFLRQLYRTDLLNPVACIIIPPEVSSHLGNSLEKMNSKLWRCLRSSRWPGAFKIGFQKPAKFRGPSLRLQEIWFALFPWMNFFTAKVTCHSGIKSLFLGNGQSNLERVEDLWTEGGTRTEDRSNLKSSKQREIAMQKSLPESNGILWERIAEPPRNATFLTVIRFGLWEEFEKVSVSIWSSEMSLFWVCRFRERLFCISHK
jgi:hypothetical protein